MKYILQKPGIHEKDSTVIKHPDDGNMDSRVSYFQASICYTYTARCIGFIIYPFAFIHRRNNNTKIFPGKKQEKQVIQIRLLLFPVLLALAWFCKKMLRKVFLNI